MASGVPVHLRERYAASFATKREALDAAWTAFADAPDEARARTLRHLAHRLAGSAPAYGYEMLGALARDVDALLTDWIESATDARASPAHIVARIAPVANALLEQLAARD
jgi:HPt (histidine-containing phosphotransfer) domain-containing protein